MRESGVKIICAPDSWKETLSATDAAQAMARGIARADAGIACDLCPVADGGEGTMEALIASMGGEIHQANVIGPSGMELSARYGVTSEGTGVVELAEASGLALLPREQRNPLQTTTYGTGQLIRNAIECGCSEVIVCIGGSATVDGATGIAQALGAQFWDHAGRLIEERMTGGMLSHIASWSPPTRLVRLRVACDVTNPLCGPNGAAAVYGPQKGATPKMVKELDAGLAHLARIVGGDPEMPGAGAAGGAGFGLVNLCGATIERGIDLVLNAVRFEERCRDATLVLTGEGRLDAQSLHGKATMGVAKAAAKLGVPTIAIVGSTGEGAEQCLIANGGALHRYISLAERFGLERALREPAVLVEQLSQEIAHTFFARADR